MKPTIFLNVEDEVTFCSDKTFGSMTTILPFGAKIEVVRCFNNTLLESIEGMFAYDLSKVH